MHRVVLLGASGTFGSRLAERLAKWPRIELVLAARRPETLEAIRARLATGAKASLTVAVVDRERPYQVVELRPWAVIDAAGPFHAAGYGLARAVIEGGAHWIDLADTRDYVAGFERALNALAVEQGVLAVTGASSTPALTRAALDDMAAGWRRVDRATSTIVPGAQAPGASLAGTVLSQAGQRVSCFTGGVWTQRPAWSGLHAERIPGLGRRLVTLADTPDLDFLPQRARHEGLFFAGVAPPLLQRLVWLAAWSVRLRLLPTLRPFAPVLRPPAALLARFGSARGGMAVFAEGIGTEGEPRRARWSLVAKDDSGPNVPSAAASAVLRALIAGELNRIGATPCVGLVRLERIVAELDGLPIEIRAESWRLDRIGLFSRVLGDAFDALPSVVRQMHGGDATVATGRAVSAGRGVGAFVAERLLGLPKRGAHAARVEMTPQGASEVWTRRFGGSRFRSRLLPTPSEPGVFEERLGPASFAFTADVDSHGFRWRQAGWRLGPVRMPDWLSPRIRARCFERDGAYRFSVVVEHWALGVIVAYVGRLDVNAP
jgi:hypothetical protein